MQTNQSNQPSSRTQRETCPRGQSTTQRHVPKRRVNSRRLRSQPTKQRRPINVTIEKPAARSLGRCTTPRHAPESQNVCPWHIAVTAAINGFLLAFLVADWLEHASRWRHAKNIRPISAQESALAARRTQAILLRLLDTLPSPFCSAVTRPPTSLSMWACKV